MLAFLRKCLYLKKNCDTNRCFKLVDMPTILCFQHHLVKRAFLHSSSSLLFAVFHAFFFFFTFYGDGYLIDVALYVCLNSVLMVIAFRDRAVFARLDLAPNSCGHVWQRASSTFSDFKLLTLWHLLPQPSCCKWFRRSERKDKVY